MAGIATWAIGNLIVRDTELEAPRLALWRYVIAAGLYTGWHLWRVGPLGWTGARIAAPAAVAITVEIALFFTAIQRTTVANVTVIGSLTPLLLVGVAVRRFGERVPAAIIVAAAVGLAGVAAVVWGSTGAVSWSAGGDALAVAALLFFAAYFVLGKEARRLLPAVSLQTYTMLIGIPVLVVVSAVTGNSLAPPSTDQWIYPIGLVALPTTGHLLVNWAHQHVTLTFTSLMTLAVPVLSAMGAWMVFDERLTGIQIVGMAAVLAVLAFVVVEGERGRFRTSGS